MFADAPAGAVTLFLCGDVMLGRGIDQILPYPGDPSLREPYIRDARDYVRLAETADGPIRRPVDPRHPWGDLLAILDERAPDVRLINLETAITRSDDFEPDKGIHYRMNPANLPCLVAVRPDVCVLANNHVLDFGRRGLDETLSTLRSASLRWSGAGRDLDEARRPAIVEIAGARRVVVFAIGMMSSGVSPAWAATPGRSGVDFVARPSDAAAAELAGRIRQARRGGDVVVVSVHWGSNWGYDVSKDQIRFAHALVEAGADIVYGHSSHHPRPVEIHGNGLILYGCGDLINDYEGIGGYETYRDDLRPAYLVTVRPGSGEPPAARIVLTRSVGLRLRRAGPADAGWLRDVLGQAGRALSLNTGIEMTPEGDLAVVGPA